MSMLPSSCCCGKCYFGARSTDPDAASCAHGTAETLELRIPRPAYGFGYNYYDYQNQPGAQCPCEGQYTTRTYCPSSSCVEVDYLHFHCDTNRTYTWNILPVVGDLYPPEQSVCCGYSNSTCDDVQCVGGSASLCSSTHRLVTGDRATCSIEAAIGTGGSGGTVPRLGSDTDIAPCEYGDSFYWLQGIANSSTSDLFRKYTVAADGTPTATTSRSLEQTVLCVVHKEKWWYRSSNSLTKSDSDGGSASDRSAALCRTPRYWIFACSGVPLFHFELYDAYHVHGTITEAEMKQIFRAIVHHDVELPESAMDKLESAGVLQVKDLSRTDGKIIEKSMNYVNGGKTVTQTRQFYARPGGWTYVCHDWNPSGSNEEAMCNGTSGYFWPYEIPRQTSNADNCSFGPSVDQCYTAAPVPTNNCQCETVAASRGALCTDVCGFSPNPGLCVPSVLFSCASNDGTTCTQDTIVGNCKGVWVQFTQYELQDLSTNSYRCTMTNDGYICRVPNGGSCDFGELPDEISHLMPEVVAAAERTTPADTSICCDSIGTKKVGTTICVATNPNGTACDTPDQWGGSVCS